MSVLYIEEYSSKISFVFRFAVCATTQNVAALELGLPFRQRAYRGCAPSRVKVRGQCGAPRCACIHESVRISQEVRSHSGAAASQKPISRTFVPPRDPACGLEQVRDVGRHLLDLRRVVLLDLANRGSVLLGDEVDGNTLTTETPGATDTMQVVLDVGRQVEVDD